MKRFLAKKIVMIGAAGGIGLVVAGCQVPKDPNESFNNFKQGQALNVGIVHNPPYATMVTGTPSGREVDILKRFAAEHGGQLNWQQMGPQHPFELLKQGKLDIVIGGFKKGLPFKDVGYTRPYYGDHVIAVQPGENRLLVSLELFLNKSGERFAKADIR